MARPEPKKPNVLFEKLVVGAVELPNRIIFGSHPTNFAKNNLFTDQHVAYYEARARGGAGLIVLEEQSVHPSDLPYEKIPFGFNVGIIEGYQKIANAVHKHGGKVVAQLNHSGMQSEGSTSMHELWAPSAMADVVSGEVAKAMEPEDIKAVVAGFARVTEHAVKGDLDGVEINAAQFSLLRQFMSPLTNTRSDIYGGELENRLLFTKEVLLAVRQKLGPQKLLGLRLCGDEFAPWGGITPQDAMEIARNLARLNIIDYLAITVGSLYTLNLTPATYYAEEGFAVGVASEIKKAVTIPVFAEGRIHRPQYAKSIIEQGLVDAVCMNRALIADPELPNKVANGIEEEVIGCLSCNQGCVVRRSMGKPLFCQVNPVVGEEIKQKPRRKPLKAKQILVVGGGPAGMEAAALAAERGHKVTLWEERPHLGGHLADNADKREYVSILNLWERLLAKYRVKVVTAKTAQVTDILAEQADAVILATGSKDGEPPIAAQECPGFSARTALNTELRDKTILFWDEIGDQLTARTVGKLFNDGNKVYFVTSDLFAGNKMAATFELNSFNPILMNGAAGIYPMSQIVEIKNQTAIIKHIYSGVATTISGIDTFVYNCWSKPNDIIYNLLLGQVKELHRIGDCVAPRGIGYAVREGFMLGNSI
ncbi:MAG: FAD-dependent oxidoreductase [Syntrophomonas sp.]